jgi:hypothetical protein
MYTNPIFTFFGFGHSVKFGLLWLKRASFVPVGCDLGVLLTLLEYAGITCCQLKASFFRTFSQINANFFKFFKKQRYPAACNFC